MANRLEQEIPGYHSGIRVIRRGTEALSGVLTKSSFTKVTIDNIGGAVELWKNGADSSVWAAHESDLDRPFLGEGVRRAGFAEYSDEMVTMMGVRVLAKPIRGFAARAYPHIAFPQDQTGEWRKLLLEAKTAVPKLLKQHKVIVAFPGGTRSKDGVLAETHPLMGNFLTEKGVILPIAIEGAREAWPVEGRPKLFSEIVLHAGKPIIISEIIEEVDFEEKRVGRRLKASERNAILVDAITRWGIAPLVPDWKRGAYINLNRTVAEMLQDCAKKEKVTV